MGEGRDRQQSAMSGAWSSWSSVVAIYRVQDHHPPVVDAGVAVVAADRNQLGPARIHGNALGLGVLDVVVQADQTHFARLAHVRLAHIELAAQQRQQMQAKGVSEWVSEWSTIILLANY